jgi:orotidine-5'-phosphate decarboxylase
MTTIQLTAEIFKKKSFLCIGLDPDSAKMPAHLKNDPDAVFNFCKAVIDSTHDLAVAYKPNTAFFEVGGRKGWETLGKVAAYLNERHPEIFTIADAKRGDIGNTSGMYAKTFLHDMDFDAVTVAPYMGKDSVAPFLGIEGKFAILLALTSNEGAFDFQTRDIDGKPLYQHVIETSQTWPGNENLMYVVGATKSVYLSEIRRIVPNSWLLVPGVGAQGGSLSETCALGANDNVGILVNASRTILYASAGKDFAEKARSAALSLQAEMEELLRFTYPHKF